MNFGKALAIVIQIDSDKFTDEEKATAIHLVMNAPTHNSITKDNMLKVIKWLWNKVYEFVDEKEGVELGGSQVDKDNNRHL